MSDIEAIDGEAIEGLYALMRCSDGRELRSRPERELRTQEIFDWLAHKKGRTRYSIFGLGYDANMWMRDLPKAHLKRLWEEGKVGWNGWIIDWIPSKLFIARSVSEPRSFIAEECWGFFQTSFIKALERYKIDCPDVIEWGKQERVAFGWDDADKASKYCLAECRALRDLMSIVRDRSQTVGLTPPTWIGPGVLAGTLMHKQGVREHLVQDHKMKYPSGCMEAVLSAYFGGRIEALYRGRVDKAYAYDLSSAYPHALLSLPDLENATVESMTEYDPSEKHAIWKCSWKTGSMETPFPVRVKGCIWYPAEGVGWYHADEVRNAVKMFDGCINVWNGYVLRSATDVKPFDWITGIYDYRVRLSRDGDMAAHMLKLAMNSVYGKLVQSQNRKVNGKTVVPKWRQMWWGGEVTSITRARLLDAMALSSSHPLLIATDGLIYGETLPLLAVSEARLGGWELTEITDLCLLGPGIYSYSIGEDRYRKTRGFMSRAVDHDVLEREILAGRGYKYADTRFIGAGAALSRKDMSLWRTWLTDPDRKIFAPMDRREYRDGAYWPVRDVLISEPYRPKGKYFDDNLDEMYDQPEVCDE